MIMHFARNSGKWSKAARKLAPLLAQVLDMPNRSARDKCLAWMLEAQPGWVDFPVGENGQTALMKAAAQGDLNLVDILREHGANAKKKNNKGETALNMAVQFDGNHRFQEAVVDAELAKVPQSSWASFYMLDAVRTRAFVQAHAEGAVPHFMDADWNEEDPQWQPLSELGTDSLAEAMDALTHRRRTRSGSRCVMTQTFFRFLPTGWTIEDYDPQEQKPQAFIDALISRNMVTEKQVEAWYLETERD
jgi:hypothetical protein